MPPLHPALVHFPIVLVFVAILADLWAGARKSPSANSLGWWCWLGTTVAAAGAIALGYYDMHREALQADSHELVHLHMRIGWCVGVAALVMTVWRAFLFGRHQFPRVGFLLIGLVVVGLIFFQGWFGGEMVYSRGPGVAATGQGTEPVAEAASRVEAAHAALEPVLEPGESEHEHEGMGGGEQIERGLGSSTNSDSSESGSAHRP